MSTVSHDLATYFGRFREFDRQDWVVYLSWVGLMLGLTLSTSLFLTIGLAGGASFPAEAFFVPIGAGIFTLAIAVDTIGHRTVYKEILKQGEGFVHSIIVFMGILSCILLCAAYLAPSAFWIPAMLLTVLSFAYSWIDEAIHWRRYFAAQSDRVEMWSHAFILLGHGIMMLGWWRWFFLGYPGVTETVDTIASFLA